MKSFAFGLLWIATEDEPSDTDPASIAGYISTGLLSDLYGANTDRIGEAVATIRQRIDTYGPDAVDEDGARRIYQHVRRDAAKAGALSARINAAIVLTEGAQ